MSNNKTDEDQVLAQQALNAVSGGLGTMGCVSLVSISTDASMTNGTQDGNISTTSDVSPMGCVSLVSISTISR